MKKFKNNLLNALRIGLENMGFKFPSFQFSLPWTSITNRQENTKSQITVHDKKAQQGFNRRHGKDRI
jgi:hypothetical protein